MRGVGESGFVVAGRAFGLVGGDVGLDAVCLPRLRSQRFSRWRLKQNHLTLLSMPKSNSPFLSRTSPVQALHLGFPKTPDNVSRRGECHALVSSSFSLSHLISSMASRAQLCSCHNTMEILRVSM